MAALMVGVFMMALSCQEPKKEIPPDEIRNYIAAYTSGAVSSETPIRVRLVDVPGDWREGAMPEKGLFKTDPAISGKTYLGKFNTLEFIPDERLEQGKNYEVELRLDKIFDDLPQGMETFSFDITVIEQDFDVRIKGLSPDEETPEDDYLLTGELITADVAETATLEKMAGATLGDEELPVKWLHEKDRRVYSFTVSGIPRGDAEQELLVSFDGKPLGTGKEVTRTVTIPSREKFTVTSVDVTRDGRQSVVVRFSDPLMQGQNLRGLITLSSAGEPNLSVSGNSVTIYPEMHLSGEKTLEVFRGVRNNRGLTLEKDLEFALSFENLKPEVRLLSKGVILPSSGGLVLNFEAVSLNAVDISVIRIYEKNIPQFLQVNRLDGEWQLTRVGTPVLKKRVSLGGGENVSTGMWKAYSADLSGLMADEPGAMYRVILSFEKEYSTYSCDGPGAGAEQPMASSETYDLSEEFGSWDNNDSYFSMYRYPDGYRWSERDNPCHVSYYLSDRWVSTNLLASDLGIIAKGASGNDLLFAVTSLVSAKPMADVRLDIYDFQLQEIGSAVTGSDGFATVSAERKPYLLIASNGSQQGYLRLDDGTSLSLSRFDVGGTLVQEGLKGFIYGDRGVWRPGDTLFLNFMLYDEDNSLPKGHPVVMTITNPQGQVVERVVRKENVSGIYNFTTTTDPGAPTGNWNASVEVGGATFSKRLRIETVKPNRLKIDLDLGVDTIYGYRGRLRGTISSRWLHGAPAGNLEAKVEMTLMKSEQGFKGYDGYTFNDPTRRFYSSTVTVFDDTLDDRGNAAIRAEIPKTERAPGLLNALIYSRVFERGGDFSFEYRNMVYAPFERYVGIRTPEGDQWGRLLVDSTHTVDIVTLDAYGKPMAVKDLEVVIFKVKWNWWWNASDDDLASYYGDDYHDPILRTTVSTGPDGKATVKFSVPYPEWGRFLVHVSDAKGGHAAGRTVYVDWPGFAGRDRSGHAEGASMLAFSTDKETYKVGETVKVTFPSSGTGRALMSLENGSKILDAFWIAPEEGQTVYSFTATREMSPNIYINLTLIQPHAQTANDLPVRLYGIRPVMVEDPGTKLMPVIEMPDELRPEEPVTITVREENGRGMGYTIAVVDEGLLDLTRFSTPSPWSTFFAREALGVKTWDLYDYVIGAYPGELTRLLAIGGGLEGEDEGKREVNRFKPVARLFGPYYLGKGKDDEVTFTMPNYVGSVRAMVVAAGDGAFGSAEETVPVRKPLMVLATLPRVLGPGESVKLPVNVFAMDGAVKDVLVNIETYGMLKVKGRASGNLTFSEKGDKLITFELEVGDRIGTGKVRINASGGNETAYQEIEIEIRNPNPPVTKSVLKVIPPGEEISLDLELPGMPGTNEVLLEISGQPSVDFGRRLKYLTGYPHGCAEQIISGAFPQLYLESVMELAPALREKTGDNIRSVINRVHRMQMSNGGIRYWPGQTRANDWITSYAGHFMIEAQKKGYTLPFGFVDNWLRYQGTAANEWRREVRDFRGYYYQSALTQAYRLYTLALARQPQMGAMNRLREEAGIEMQAKWRLAAAYTLAGQPEIATDIVEGLTTIPGEYEYFSSTFGSSLRDQAMILETLLLLNRKDEAFPLMFDISEQLGKSSWYSTQTTAYCLVAIAKFVGENTGNEEFRFDVDSEQTTSRQISSERPFYQLPLDVGDGTRATATIANPTGKDIYLAAFLTGTPLEDREEEVDQYLNMEVTYFTMDGRSLDVTKLDQGTDFYAEAVVHNPGSKGRLTDLALSQIFPSGWEIINTRLTGFEPVNSASTPEYQDFRDDRVYTYFDIYPGNTLKFRILLNAAYLGSFYLPAVACEAMYDNMVNAREPGKWVEVGLPGE